MIAMLETDTVRRIKEKIVTSGFTTSIDMKLAHSGLETVIKYHIDEAATLLPPPKDDLVFYFRPCSPRR